jgi:hypothetical protein
MRPLSLKFGDLDLGRGSVKLGVMGSIHRTVNVIIALALAALGCGGFVYFYFIAAAWKRRAILAFGRVPQLAFGRVPQPGPKTGELNLARGPKSEKRSAGRIARSHWGCSGPGCSELIYSEERT